MSDDDIEFLDEDAEIVQQYVQSIHLQPTIKTEPVDEEEPPVHVIQKHKQETSLLIERPPVITEKPPTTKKRKRVEDDTDYDPSVDSPYFNRRRRYNPKVSNVRKYETDSRSSQQPQSSPVRKVALPRTQINRRDMIIKIPDFDDPLCLPVRALVKDENDARRLRHWNQLCLDQFRNNDTPLLQDTGPVASSKRVVVIRNVFNKYSGKTETTFWSKISVQGVAGDVKSDVVQAVLPRYREKKILTAYKLGEVRRRRTVRQRADVLLARETYGDDDTLVAYRPDTCSSMIFKMFDSSGVSAGVGGGAAEEERRYLLELASCTACARCYQASWRAGDVPVKDVVALSSCPVCARACGSAAALVAHVKSHAARDVRAHRRAICEALAKLVPYQYRCRVCQRQFSAVRALRRHLATHKPAGGGELYCEVGDHTVS